MAIVRKTLSSQRHQHTPEEVARLRAQNDARPDDDIDYSDIPQQNPKDWEQAVQGRFYRPIKKPITIRIDADVLHWLKRDGEGYQSRLNAILRDAMVHDLREHPSRQTANKTCTG